MSSRATSLAVVVVVSGLLVDARGAGSGQNPPQQTPTFRAGTDIVVVDALVAARDGSPIDGLKAEQFEVFIDGRRRPVLSADLVRASESGHTPAATTTPSAQPTDGVGRIIMLAVDEASFPVAAQQSAREAVTRVVDRVAPEDYLGMITFPGEVAIGPTRDRSAVRDAISRIVGARVDVGASSRFNVSASEAGQLRSRASVVTREIINRECRGAEAFSGTCPQEVMQTAHEILMTLEQQAMLSLAGLHRTLDAVASMPGRKTLIVISAGLPMSTQRGSHPDFAAETARIASRAAAANVNLYVFYMNVHFLQFFSAAYRKVNHAIYADITMFGHGLERFADGAGGAFFQIEVDSDPFVERALRETSASYLLAVRADPKDQDGKEHFIRVAVKARGATVRHRRVVTIPVPGR
jgi:VWFA-related protein